MLCLFPPPAPPLHRRRHLRKAGCCLCSLGDCLLLNAVTLGAFTPCCLLPRTLGATFKGMCGVPAAAAFVVGFLAAVALAVVLADVIFRHA